MLKFILVDFRVTRLRYTAIGTKNYNILFAAAGDFKAKANYCLFNWTSLQINNSLSFLIYSTLRAY